MGQETAILKKSQIRYHRIIHWMHSEMFKFIINFQIQTAFSNPKIAFKMTDLYHHLYERNIEVEIRYHKGINAILKTY